VIIEKEELLSIIPHKGRMLLLSRVMRYDMEERIIETEYDVTKDCLFYDSIADGVPSWVCFEFIAQSIGAFSGIRNRILGIPTNIGFVLGISQVKTEIPFIKTGNVVTIKTKQIENIELLYVFTGEVFLEDRKIFEGKLTVVDLDDEHFKILKKESGSIE